MRLTTNLKEEINAKSLDKKVRKQNKYNLNQIQKNGKKYLEYYIQK